MKKLAICHSTYGKQLLAKINSGCKERGLEPIEEMEKWDASAFQPGNALIFIGATGIAVRAISGLPKDKLSDCPVIVIDDHGNFVIPLLSGHAGSANKLAAIFAEILDAIPVITTSTDVNEAFSVDTFAVENRLTIANKEGIKKVSLKALDERKVTLSIKNFPPKDPVDVIIADETDAVYSLLLRPKPYTVGLGLKKDKDAASLNEFFIETLQENGIEPCDVYALCTIDRKEDEPAILMLRDTYRIPVIAFDAEILKQVTGDFSASAFVQETVGVDNVCERAAVLGAGSGAQLIVKKLSRDGMTIAIAKRRGV